MHMCDQHNTNANSSDPDLKVIRSLPAIMALVDQNGNIIRSVADIDPHEYVKENPGICKVKGESRKKRGDRNSGDEG